jgi:hypothetical protein
VLPSSPGTRRFSLPRIGVCSKASACSKPDVRLFRRGYEALSGTLAPLPPKKVK